MKFQSGHRKRSYWDCHACWLYSIYQVQHTKRTTKSLDFWRYYRYRANFLQTKLRTDMALAPSKIKWFFVLLVCCTWYIVNPAIPITFFLQPLWYFNSQFLSRMPLEHLLFYIPILNSRTPLSKVLYAKYLGYFFCLNNISKYVCLTELCICKQWLDTWIVSGDSKTQQKKTPLAFANFSRSYQMESLVLYLVINAGIKNQVLLVMDRAKYQTLSKLKHAQILKSRFEQEFFLLILFSILIIKEK